MKNITARVLGLAAVAVLTIAASFQSPTPPQMACCTNPGNPGMACCAHNPGMECCRPKPANLKSH